MLLIILTAFAVFLLWQYLKKPFDFWKEKGVTQTKPWPLVGDLMPIIFGLQSRMEHCDWLYSLYPDKRYVGFYSFRQPALLIRDPELIKKLAIKDFDHFVDHESIFSIEDSLFSKMLIFLKGDLWKDTRARLSGSFTSSKMKYMFNTIKAASEKFTNYFDQLDKDFIELEMKDTYTRFGNDVIASAAFGVEIDTFKNPNNEFYLTGIYLFTGGKGQELLKLLLYVMPGTVKKVLGLVLPKNRVVTSTDYFEKVIYESIEFREKNNVKRNDMVNLLLEIKHGDKHEDEKVNVDTGYAAVEESEIGKTVKKEKLVEVTNKFIAAQAAAFFVAGFETLSTAMSFGAYELALNPEVQKKLRKEIKETLEECNGTITYDVLLQMKYMDMVVSEILRKWHPSGQAINRVCTKPYTIEAERPDEKPVTLKQGDLLWLPYGSIQKDPKYWPEPEKFDPERFSDENKHKIVPYSYLPFGVGPRNCIGFRFGLLEIKSMLFHLLQKFEFVRIEKTEVPLTFAKNTFQHTAEHGYWLGLRKAKE